MEINIKPIKTDLDLKNALKRLEVIFFAEEGTPEFDEMRVLTTLIEAYEDKHYPISNVEPVEINKFKIAQISKSQ